MRSHPHYGTSPLIMWPHIDVFDPLPVHRGCSQGVAFRWYFTTLGRSATYRMRVAATSACASQAATAVSCQRKGPNAQLPVQCHHSVDQVIHRCKWHDRKAGHTASCGRRSEAGLGCMPPVVKVRWSPLCRRWYVLGAAGAWQPEARR
jgi:hypothetical protein